METEKYYILVFYNLKYELKIYTMIIYTTGLHCFKNIEFVSLHWTYLISTGEVFGKNKTQL